MHFSGSCKRDVCLFDNTWKKKKSVTGWDLKSTKNAGFPISTTDCTYAFCTSGIFLYWRLKDTTKKKKILEKKTKKTSCLAWWCGPTPPTGPRVWFLAGVAGSWLLISDFLGDLWLLFLSLSFPSLECFSFFLSFFLSPCFLYFCEEPEGSRVSDPCFLLLK